VNRWIGEGIDPEYQPIPVKAVMPRSLGTKVSENQPLDTGDKPAATICKTDAGYELKKAQISRPSSRFAS